MSGVSQDVEAIDGNWSTWSPWTECASECVVTSLGEAAVGISSSERKCDHPAPRNSGKACRGSYKRHRLCAADKVSPVERGFRDGCLMEKRD